MVRKHVYSDSKILALADGVYFNSLDGMFRWTYTGQLELLEADSTIRLAGSDSAGNLFVWRFEGTTARLYRPSKTGVMTLLAGRGTADPGRHPCDFGAALHPPDPVADPQGNVLFSDGLSLFSVEANTGLIQRLASPSTATYAGDGRTLANTKFGSFKQLAIDTQGNIFVADSVRVRRISAGTKIVSTVAGGGAGGDGAAAAVAQLAAPRALAFDPVGNLYIADTDNIRIRIRIANCSAILPL